MSSRRVRFEWLETLRTNDVYLQIGTDPGLTDLIVDERFVGGCGTGYTVSFVEGLPVSTIYLPSIFGSSP